jgi:NAD(P)-dependent dehydrogenase (short-subunit alcohol dehydrogenase family)
MNGDRSRGRLAGKVALITGTGGGQGRAAALLFAAEGATVVGCDLKTDGAGETVELVGAAGGQMNSTHPLDLTDEDAVRAWIDGAAVRHGRLDVLYNNAGATRFDRIEDDGGWSSVLPGAPARPRTTVDGAGSGSADGRQQGAW